MQGTHTRALNICVIARERARTLIKRFIRDGFWLLGANGRGEFIRFDRICRVFVVSCAFFFFSLGFRRLAMIARAGANLETWACGFDARGGYGFLKRIASAAWT